jgi:hypothetical protein
VMTLYKVLCSSRDVVYLKLAEKRQSHRTDQLMIPLPATLCFLLTVPNPEFSKKIEPGMIGSGYATLVSLLPQAVLIFIASCHRL